MNYLKRILKINSKYELHRFLIRQDDVFLVSYPKSGNTWVRFMIGNYLSDSPLDFSSIHKVVPDIYFKPEQEFDLRNQSPRFIKSHEQYNKKYPNVIYLMRDGRDVAVSYYFQYLKFRNNNELKFEEFIDKFNKGQVGGNSWSEHVESWLDNKVKRVHLTRYEDLKVNPVGELIKILIFAKIPVDYKRVERAVELSSFNRMSKIEEVSEKDAPFLKNSNLEVKFVREGKMKSYLNYFTEDLLSAFYENHGKLLKRVGYEIPEYQ
jgi:hypothetical protein